MPKNKIKSQIDNTSNIFNVKPKKIFDKISSKSTLLFSEYKSIRSSTKRYVNKSFPKDIDSLEDIPEKNEYYETIDKQEFKIFKNSKLLILQSPFQAKAHLKYKDNIYVDGPFMQPPK